MADASYDAAEEVLRLPVTTVTPGGEVTLSAELPPGLRPLVLTVMDREHDLQGIYIVKAVIQWSDLLMPGVPSPQELAVLFGGRPPSSLAKMQVVVVIGNGRSVPFLAEVLLSRKRLNDQSFHLSAEPSSP